MKSKAIITLVCFLIPAQIFGWGKAGHEAVAIVAQSMLGERARQHVQMILGGNIGLKEIATCADAIKRRRFLCGKVFPLEAAPHTSPWHYINIATKDNPNPETLLKYCQAKTEQANGNVEANNCVLAQMKAQFKVLKNKKTSQKEKQIALMFLVHFVGDAHQPLHAATEIDENGAEDAGGNKKTVFFEGQMTNLHAFWDNLIDISKRANADALARRLLEDLKHKDTSQWIKGDFITQSVLESFQISKTLIYPDYHRNGAEMDRAYQVTMQAVVRERLEKAAVRLAKLLNDAL